MKMADPRTFRATLEAWLGQLLLPMCFFIMLTITAINAAGLSPVTGGISLGILAVIVILDYMIPMVRNWLYLDFTSIEGSLNGHYFHVYWNEILAAWLYENHRKRFLCLGTRDGTLIIPLRFFDHVTLWAGVRGAVQPAALEESAIERLPDFQNWEKARGTVHDTETQAASRCQVTDHWLLQVVGWSGVAFFSFGVIEALQAGSLIQAIFYLGIIAACGVLLLGWGVTEIGSEQIRRFTVFGRWAIPWDEVLWIEMDLFDAVIVLVGSNRRLVIPGPGIWNITGKREMMRILLEQVKLRGIPMRRTLLAFLRFSRNTRAKRQHEDQS